jgi:hypothetical protein
MSSVDISQEILSSPIVVKGHKRKKLSDIGKIAYSLGLPCCPNQCLHKFSINGNGYS